MNKSISEQLEQTKQSRQAEPEKLQNPIQANEQENESLSEEELKEVSGGLRLPLQDIYRD